MSSDLRVLADARRRGKTPVMPVFVGQDWNFLEQNVRDIGCAFIRIRDGWEKWDWTPLAGLVVICDLPLHLRSVDILRAIKAARPRRLEAMVDGELTVVFPPFNEKGQAI